MSSLLLVISITQLIIISFSLPDKFEIPKESSLSEQFFLNGVEKQIVQIFNAILNNSARSFHTPSNYSAEKSMVLDIGMNAGYYTLLSASWQVDVLSIEPQPKCHEIIQKSLVTVNHHLAKYITTMNCAAGRSGRRILISPDNCDPGFVSQSHSSQSVDTQQRNQEDRLQSIAMLPVSTLLSKSAVINIVKIDTEGAELNILQDLIHFYRSGGYFAFLVVEVAPHVWHFHSKTKENGIEILQELKAMASKTVLLMDDKDFKFPHASTTYLRDLFQVDGDTFVDFEMAHLVEDRLRQRGGCNIFFQFYRA